MILLSANKIKLKIKYDQKIEDFFVSTFFLLLVMLYLEVENHVYDATGLPMFNIKAWILCTMKP